jgi:prepilin-type N-terminal cleavage/methylation domain-containing protein
MNTRPTNLGFTLVEVMVTVSVIIILSTIVFTNVNSGSAQARDAERLSDIRNIESALERYRLEHGRYPEACNGPFTWSGEADSPHPCPGGDSQYIVGDLSETTSVTENFAPTFIPTLPTDPKGDDPSGGYVYAVDGNGDVYKFMALNTVESESVDVFSEFSRCGNWNDSQNECAAVPNSPMGSGPYNQTGSTPSVCNTASEYSNDYAVSTGFSSGEVFLGQPRTSEKAREYFTDEIRCK